MLSGAFIPNQRLRSTRAYDEPYSKLGHESSHSNSLQLKATALLAFGMDTSVVAKTSAKETDLQHQEPNLLLEAVEVRVAGHDDARLRAEDGKRLLLWFLKTARPQSSNVSYPAAYCAVAVRRITLINKKSVSIGESHGAAEWKPRRRKIS